MSGENKPAMKRIGYFGEAGYISIGDPFKTKQNQEMERIKNAQFQTNPTFKQKYNLGNGLFSKAPPLYNVNQHRELQHFIFYPCELCLFAQGEMYTTLEAFQRKERNAGNKKRIADVPFKPSSPTKFQSGNLGSNFGTVGYTDRKTPDFPLGGKLVYVPHGTVKKTARQDVVHEPYNIVTNPPKKGGFGFANYGIGAPKEAAARRAWKGVAGEYAYLPDPYDSARIAEREFRKKQPKNVSDTPFRPANPSKLGGPGMWGGHRAMSDHPKDCGGAISRYFEYMPVGTDKKKTKANVAAAHPRDKYDRGAFKPPNPSKKGGPGFWGCGKKSGGSVTLCSFPEALPDPYDTLRLKLTADRAARKTALGALAERPPFNAQSFGRSKRTPSVFTMNIRI